MNRFFEAARVAYRAKRAKDKGQMPTLQAHSKAPARPLTEDDVDGWLAATDRRRPEAITQLEQLINQLAEEHPFKGARIKADFAWVLKQADKRDIRWNRG